MHRGCQRWRPLWFADSIVTQRGAVRSQPSVFVSPANKCQLSTLLLSQGVFQRFSLGRNPVSRLQDMEKGCARAHVQMHSTSDLCKSNSLLVYKHIPNLNAIGPTVMELSMVGCLRHPLTRHMSRAVAGTGGIGVGQIRNTLNGDIKQKRPLVNRSTCSRDISFSKASRGRVGLD